MVTCRAGMGMKLMCRVSPLHMALAGRMPTSITEQNHRVGIGIGIHSPLSRNLSAEIAEDIVWSLLALGMHRNRYPALWAKAKMFGAKSSNLQDWLNQSQCQI